VQRCTILVDQQFGYAAPLLDLAGISTEFSAGRSLLSFLSSIGLYARGRHCYAARGIGLGSTHF